MPKYLLHDEYTPQLIAVGTLLVDASSSRRGAMTASAEGARCRAVPRRGRADPRLGSPDGARVSAGPPSR